MLAAVPGKSVPPPVPPARSAARFCPARARVYTLVPGLLARARAPAPRATSAVRTHSAGSRAGSAALPLAPSDSPAVQQRVAPGPGFECTDNLRAPPE
ncbi:hypothetical protein NDU88_002382 [Pleurodeles waltl]|uniref:Uncharacterized protein n=1 Tax=Pleurodeles waltl TaxID=8319 RepID=A0AAV7SD32_PLEWA|nr:hypothetical protein NDU88_002382 [Pleurodeles waltl]